MRIIERIIEISLPVQIIVMIATIIGPCSSNKTALFVILAIQSIITILNILAAATHRTERNIATLLVIICMITITLNNLSLDTNFYTAANAIQAICFLALVIWNIRKSNKKIEKLKKGE